MTRGEALAFWSRTEPGPEDCIDWSGYRNVRGYGVFTHLSKRRLAHRAVLLMRGVEIPDGYEVDHLCHRPACVNPDHLEVVTPRENARRSPRVKLTPEDVRQIRSEFREWPGTVGSFGRHVADRFGMTGPGIEAVVRRTTWADISDKEAA
jgi:hypothetical protein